MKSRILMASVLLLAACASGPSAKQAAGAGAAAEGSLPAQTLAPGACGLFLWTQDEPRRFILFYPSDSATADAIVNGQRTKLSIESRGGEVFTQFMTEMSFRTPAGNPVTLSLQPGEQIEGGRRVPVARMISQDREGWEIITPLAGLTACQPK